MSDRMVPFSFDTIMKHVLEEYKSNKTIFGVHKLYSHQTGETIKLFGESLELPFGPAAGPHTQLAQNLIAAYVAGARFFELKTVQTLDGEDLPVSKPCILAQDEGYNVEWSTELYVPEALNEYIKGWFALKLLSKELGLGSDNGFIFNMSVGYDLEGIKSKKIDTFIESLKDASNCDEFLACQQWALDNINLFKNISKEDIMAVSPNICRSITLSTLHGCPPAEIERIATYLINEKKINTFIKCNPTLLGYNTAREILNSLGFDYIQFDDHHFKADLQFADAVPMLERLQQTAANNNLAFGVKLTNTFPVDIAANELPGTEMYMSGRSLFLLSVEVAKRLTKSFNGKLRISFSGGADAGNIKSLYDAGIWPITLATTLLKPGGYNRLAQIADILKAEKANYADISLDKLNLLFDHAKTDKAYQKPIKPSANRKKDDVPLLNCFTAPCRGGCPFGQDIPAYLRAVQNSDFESALRIILDKNPLPFITGTICAHNCTSRCTKSFYGESVDIRKAKLLSAQKAYDKILPTIKQPETNGKRACVIGGGPAGMAAAYLLAKNGTAVDLFEKRDALGGIVRFVIPSFRIKAEDIEKDAALLKQLGVNIHLNTEITSADTLKSYDTIILAIGAWKSGGNVLESGNAIDALDFLQQVENSNYTLPLGEDVAVIGGGNTAMDTARAAKRVKGVKNVRLIYRRNKRFMPADEEELALALADGVEFCELLAPISHSENTLMCEKMTLGAPDEKGRRSPQKTGEMCKIKATTVVAAIGQKIDNSLYNIFGLCNADQAPTINPETLETTVKNVYLIGDGMGGAATVAEAIADASAVVKAVLGNVNNKYEIQNPQATRESALANRGVLGNEKCLECAAVCEACVDVCPNRANVSVYVNDSMPPQIIHVDDMCNECGNCTAFCPYASSPYKDKLTLFKTEKTFSESTNAGFLPLGGTNVTLRLGNKTASYDVADATCDLIPDLRLTIVAALSQLKMLY